MPSGVYKRTQYHKDRISETNSRYWKGKKFSKEHLMNLSEVRKGVKRVENKEISTKDTKWS